MFAVNGNGDHLLAVKFQAVSLLWTLASGRTLMRHNADRMANNFFVVANGTFASHAIISRTPGHPRFAPFTARAQSSTELHLGNISATRYLRVFRRGIDLLSARDIIDEIPSSRDAELYHGNQYSMNLVVSQRRK